MNFTAFKNAVAKQYDRMQKHQMFRVQVDKDQLWETYLTAFPAGSNELYRERAEHDCNCCKRFIRAIGDVVAIVDGKIMSIWDIDVPKEPDYQIVANALSELVKSAKVGDFFLHYEPVAGVDKNFEQLLDKKVKTWEHFFVNIKREHVVSNKDLATNLAETRAIHDVLLRGLTELALDDVDAVLDLISQGSLYRGEESKFALTAFRKLKVVFDKLPTDSAKDLFVWTSVKGTSVSVSKIRNTALGTLLIDLAAGKDLEVAVKSFEVMMGAANYKRPTALVTKVQIEKAKVKIAELGLTSALTRRYANIHDIKINNILHANRAARTIINGDIFDELAESATTKIKNLDKVEEVSIERFLVEILPRAESVEVMVENQHASNLVSLIAPDDETAGALFKWDNKFSWAYAGDAADSIKERVKAAGGVVEGDLCCRLAWDYSDDLDFHMKEPGGGHIYFSNRRSLSRNGGMLDIDANGIDGIQANPVENIFYKDRNKMAEGIYTLEVNNYTRRSDGVGFEVELEFGGQRINIVYDKVLRTSETVAAAQIKYSKAGGFEVIKSLPSTQASKQVWGVPTQTFRKVNVVMMSPNYWDGQGVGNKHYFFMVDGCVNDGSARGFFNEFLKPELNEHRKVLEMVGSKMKVDTSQEQLSGLGFSSTQRNTLVCRVKGSITRTIKIAF